MGIGPWSHSSLTAYETCPRRYYLTRVAKVVKEAQGEPQRWGDWVHKQFEVAVRDGAPLDGSIKRWQSIADKLAARPGEKFTERKMAVTRGYAAADWWESWSRCIVDYTCLDGDTALVLDYKTGKRKPSSDQLMLTAGIIFGNHPEVTKVRTGFLWLKDNKSDWDMFTREHIPMIWNEFIPRVRRMELAYEKDKWLPKPSGLCREWCPVGKNNCEFCGRK
jgi:hypothetical protein